MKENAPSQVVASIRGVSRVPTSTVFRVDVAAGSVTRSLYLTADVLASPARFARELLRELGMLPEPCQHTRHGGWPLGLWHSLIAARMESLTNSKRARRDQRPTRQK